MSDNLSYCLAVQPRPGVKPVAESAGHTHVRVSILHVKPRVLLDVTPVTIMDGGVEKFTLGTGRTTRLGLMPRRSSQNLERYFSSSRRLITDQQGEPWALLQLVLAEHGLELAPAQRPSPAGGVAG